MNQDNENTKAQDQQAGQAGGGKGGRDTNSDYGGGYSRGQDSKHEEGHGGRDTNSDYGGAHSRGRGQGSGGQGGSGAA